MKAVRLGLKSLKREQKFIFFTLVYPPKIKYLKVCAIDTFYDYCSSNL